MTSDDVLDPLDGQGKLFPDGRPVPMVLTKDEVIELLRMDTYKDGGDMALKGLVGSHQLDTIRLGRECRYLRASVIECLRRRQLP